MIKVIVVDGKEVILVFLDIIDIFCDIFPDIFGGEENDMMRKILFRDSHGFVIVYNITLPFDSKAIEDYFQGILFAKDLDAWHPIVSNDLSRK